jgi:hypothetical protein
MSLAQVVMDVQTGHHRGESSARLVHAKELGHGVAQCLRGSVRPQSAPAPSCGAARGRDRVALGMVGIQEAFR